MRRGHYLESELNRVICFLNAKGIHAHKNHVSRTVDGIYLEGEPFDYEVFCSPPHVFDAKESKTDRWSLGNAKPHQVKALLDCRNSGAEAYFLVLFPSGLRRFDAEQVRAAMAEGKKTLRAEEGEVWEWEQFLS